MSFSLFYLSQAYGPKNFVGAANDFSKNCPIFGKILKPLPDFSGLTAAPQWAPHISGVRTLVAESEAKDGGNWTAIVRQFQSPYSRGQVISLFLAGSDRPENPRIFAFFFILRAQKWEKNLFILMNLFLCIYPKWVP